MNFELYTSIEDIKQAQMGLHPMFSKEEVEMKIKRVRELERLN